MKEKTKRKLRTFVCLLMIPVFLTGCRIKTTPLGVFAQILEYASASGSSSSQSSHHGTYHSEPASTPQPQIDYDSLGDIGTVQTIMIYMVGSDLESSYGNASLDMDEMEAAASIPLIIMSLYMPEVLRNGRIAVWMAMPVPHCS